MRTVPVPVPVSSNPLQGCTAGARLLANPRPVPVQSQIDGTIKNPPLHVTPAAFFLSHLFSLTSFPPSRSSVTFGSAGAVVIFGGSPPFTLTAGSFPSSLVVSLPAPSPSPSARHRRRRQFTSVLFVVVVSSSSRFQPSPDLSVRLPCLLHVDLLSSVHCPAPSTGRPRSASADTSCSSCSIRRLSCAPSHCGSKSRSRRFQKVKVRAPSSSSLVLLIRSNALRHASRTTSQKNTARVSSLVSCALLLHSRDDQKSCRCSPRPALRPAFVCRSTSPQWGLRCCQERPCGLLLPFVAISSAALPSSNARHHFRNHG